MKQCKKCLEYKSLDEFSKDSRYKDGRLSWCRKCRSKACAEYQKRHPEKKKAAWVRWLDSHIEEHRAKVKRWRKDNPGKRASQRKRWKNSHPEKQEAYTKNWILKNPDKIIQHNRDRRARKRSAEGKFYTKEFESLKKSYNYRCLCCGAYEPSIKLVPDHVVPLSRGGSNSIENIQPLCEHCNNIKHAKTVDYRTSQYA